jgi:hypothetical protein
MTRKPIFIGGMLKSGTSLLRDILARHSTIAWGLETRWFDWDWKRRLQPEMQQTFASLARSFDNVVDDTRVLARYLGAPEVFLMIVMEELALREGKSRWVEITPGNVAHIDRIWRAFPEAQIVHVIRDPRDVFASMVKAKTSDSADEFADRWVATVGESERLLRALNPLPRNYLTIRYEHLVGAPEATMRRVLDFLGEPWEELAGEVHVKGRRANGKASATVNRLLTPITSERVGIWQKVLTERQVAAIKQSVSARGYGDLYERVLAA